MLKNFAVFYLDEIFMVVGSLFQTIIWFLFKKNISGYYKDKVQKIQHCFMKSNQIVLPD